MLRSVERSKVFVEILLLDFAFRIRSDPKAYWIFLDLEILPPDIQETDGGEDQREGEVGFLGGGETKAEEGPAEEVVQPIMSRLDCIDGIQQRSTATEVTGFRL